MFLRGKKHDIELLSTSEPGHNQALLSGGGKTQVPCLKIEDGAGKVRWMYESGDILAYLETEGLAR